MELSHEPKPLDVAGLVREHGAVVWRTLRRLGVPAADVDDLCQEVFLVAYRKAGTFEGRSSVRTWLYGIALRLAANHRRKQRPETDDAAMLEVAGGGDPEGELQRKEARALLERALAALDEDKRAAFVLFELEELPMTEVAALIGCPLQTAYSRLYAARAAVERALRNGERPTLRHPGGSS